MRQILHRTAIDMDDPFSPQPDEGFDFGTGYGYLNALRAASTTESIQVLEFVLMDADRDTAIATLHDGDTLVLDDLPTRNLCVQALVTTSGVGSVAFHMQGDIWVNNLENLSPYALFGNAGEDFFGRQMGLGTYTLSATPYTQTKRKGKEGLPLQITFTLLDNIKQFTLIDAQTDQATYTLEKTDSTPDYATIDLNHHSSEINIRADFSEKSLIGSVKFILKNLSQDVVIREVIENEVPYALAGNIAEDYLGWKARPGIYLLTATPYSKRHAAGTVGLAHTMKFMVLGSQPTDSLPNDSIPSDTLVTGEEPTPADSTGTPEDSTITIEEPFPLDSTVIPQDTTIVPEDPLPTDSTETPIDSTTQASHPFPENDNQQASETDSPVAFAYKVYPNPLGTSTVYVELSQVPVRGAKLILRSQTGELIHEQYVSPNQVANARAVILSTPTLGSGIYFLEIQASGQKRQVLRLIKP
ncbi:MAG: T9SS type A sorting domain-containing protein [Bacteroidia bacterium]|nr:T9SS type A sorting domain-containing protein [Bacteroidia bacterium]